MRYKVLLAIIICFFLSEVKAQDPIFTQSSFILETINPGFSGFEDNGRTHLGLLHRTQWPRLGLRVNTHYAFWNKSIENSQSSAFGFGFSALRQVESISKYSLNQLNANYAHRVNLNGGWFFRPAIEVGVGYKTFNFQNLTLGDQININTETINPTSVDPLVSNNDNLYFLDISSGLVLEKEEFNGITYWFGVSVKHLNRPNISFVEGDNVPLNIFYSVHGNFRFPVLNDYHLMLSANFMKQGEFNRLDIGTLFHVNQFLFGITAATNPAKNSDNSHILTSINSFIGLEYTDFRFGVSYDFNTSQIGRTDGVYELSITYLSRCRSCNTDRGRKR
ncbi:PorP/SprF family type IX secretion system membrane protein [Ichthyenterobacterium magnum]|uniref:Type IX secretion system PorP/SprF family membrane protein n=1 Tax=Ichthyenterobacterium magnum TaxID=1230530 RepID=A0A420DVW4_9FLAO|nr:PorP/SprF family type IX secretion system membrane protein [Ichthyenterobacterium magnum]RKE98355.1 type IX secretion system PorP/SprF family membrane protein [Ichthyenterobacterium magnum]